MSRYVIVEEKPIQGRPETWGEKCQREHMETLAHIEGLEIRKAGQPKAEEPQPAAPAQAVAKAEAKPQATPDANASAS